MFLPRFFACIGAVFCAVMIAMPAIASDTNMEVMPRADVEFIPLNPLRGKLGPQSGRLWGNIREGAASGTIVKFVDGFQSPPHIHNITYRAVVISGEVHNDDPNAEKLWMGPGSYWSQPAGEDHITAARGEDVLIFLEIMSGPYLVRPSKEAFDNGERPVNLEARNIVWLGDTDSDWIKGGDAEMAFLWGGLKGTEKNGTFIKLPSGYEGMLSTGSPLMRLVVIKGEANVDDGPALAPGSYIGAMGGLAQKVICRSAEPCVIYLHTEGRYQLTAG